ncbi:cytochrome c biogenesis protein CcdA [Leisingera aquaemixtae]|uniref:cytochrome c biogenesis protein CcdA n=1 Tax=Leisingera aquaemixtae TaxID=1396826 RepID=UPI0021A86CC8|nr:cytochrome c biogenesis protein CcdA [Leisingera aquaemixtae]
MFNLLVLPVGLGLFGFIEPCSIGSSLIFIKYLEGKPGAQKLSETVLFALTRALFIGGLGAAAAFVGAAFVGFQRGAWIVLGAGYAAIGILYLVGRAGFLMRTIGPRLTELNGARGSVGLGLIFGLNIPACAAPLLLVLLGFASAGGASGNEVFGGFVSLGVFGLALSLPLVAAAAYGPARRLLDRLAALAGRMPFWAGIVLVALGLWSIWFGIFAALPAPA